MRPVSSASEEMSRSDKKGVQRPTQEESLLRQIIESSLDAVISVDSKGRITTFNPAAEDMYGFAANEVLGREMAELIIPPDLRSAHHAGFKRCLETGQSRILGKRMQIRSIRSDGTEFPVDLTVAKIDEANAVRFVAFIHDVSERQRIQSELEKAKADAERAERQLRTAIEALDDGFVLYDTDDRLVICNERYREIYDTSADLLHTGTKFERVIREGVKRGQYPDSEGREEEWIAERLKAHRSANSVIEQRTDDGRWLRISERHTADDGIVGFRVDISKLKETQLRLEDANAELARASRLKDEFLASMSHELRTPLHAIIGLSEALRVGAFEVLTEEQSESVGQIEDSGRHLLKLINDILDLSKVEAGQLDLRKRKCETETICRESLRLVREAAQRKALDIQLKVSSSARVVLADPLRLKQILVNLLGNSVKFTPAGGQLGIEVTTDRSEERVNFTVWDTGIGIAEADFPRLFRPFVQLDGGLARKHSGAGLGLSLVRRLAEMHGGGVRVESNPGCGSRFIVVLPSHSETAGGGKRDKYETAEDVSDSRDEGPLLISSRPTHVLLVEDNELNAAVTSRLLGSLGYQVTVAADGWSALRHAVEDHPNIVLMDVQMSGMDGLETTRRIRANPQSESLPVVALTALAMPGDRQRCLDAGMNEYLSKPTSRKNLRDVIESFVSPEFTCKGERSERS